jgi:hypothetical protein
MVLIPLYYIHICEELLLDDLEERDVDECFFFVGEPTFFLELFISDT